VRLLKEVMSDYFDNSAQETAPVISVSFSGNRDVPVKVTRNMWEVVASPNRLKREFEFQDYQTLKAFLDEVLEYQESIQHHAKIIVDHRAIIIEVYTHDVNDVTELDQEYAKMADQILEDVKHYFLSGDIDGRF
jgi:pterin-4a-carbinolamine dehydratase